MIAMTRLVTSFTRYTTWSVFKDEEHLEHNNKTVNSNNTGKDH